MGFFGTFSTSKVTERKPANHSPNKITGTHIYSALCISKMGCGENGISSPPFQISASCTISFNRLTKLLFI